MQAYILRRLLLIIPTLLLASLIVFVAIRLIPGDIIALMAAEHHYETQKNMEDSAEEIRRQLGLDVPIYVQYGRWLKNIILHGDLGKSLWKGTPVTEEIIPRIPTTLQLGIMGMAVGLLISIPIGIYSGIRQDTIGDYVARSFAIACIAVPGFWLGTMIMVFPSLWWGWSPPVRVIPFTKDPIGNLGMFILPATILGMALAGVTMRMMRTMMLEVQRQDYIRTAWAKGLKEWVVVTRHALKNALIPVITLIGLMLPVLVSGSVIIEQIFCLPGMGRLLIDAAFERDYTILSGVVLMIAAAVLVINLLVDLAYAFLDPRVQYK